MMTSHEHTDVLKSLTQHIMCTTSTALQAQSAQHADMIELHGALRSRSIRCSLENLYIFPAGIVCRYISTVCHLPSVLRVYPVDQLTALVRTLESYSGLLLLLLLLLTYLHHPVVLKELEG